MKAIYKKLLLLLLVLPFSALAQSTLSGTVTDKVSGQPLPGVNVVVQGSNNGVSTDFDGKYQLANVKSGETVVFTYVGYKTATVKFTGQATENVSLEEDANQLQEVVVQVGYGSVKKKDATGAVTAIGTKDFNRGANVTTENLLNGRIAGVTINTSGAPGSGSQIRIRGGSSLFASNDPLIVLDGLPLDNKTNEGSTSLLAAINPNDIESITVLKDASATAIYGSRASNGVIIVTTKKGGKTLAVDYNFTYGSGKLTDKIDVFSANDYRALIHDRLPDEEDLLGTSNTDWQDEIYRRTDYVDNNISLRGSLFNVLPTRLSFGNTYQEGLRLTNNFVRNTVALNMNPSFLNDHLKMRVSANYTTEKNRFAEGVEGTAIRFDPTQPVYDPTSPFDGFFEYQTGAGVPNSQAPRNPVAQLLQTNDVGHNKRFFGNFEVDYKFHFFPDLRAIINVGFDESNGDRVKIVRPTVAATGGQNGSINGGIPFGTREFKNKTLRNKLFDGYLVYNKSINKIDIEATAGYSYQIFQESSFGSGNVVDPSSFPDVNTVQDLVLIGFFARTNLTFNSKYLLTLSYRRDASSRFLNENRWGDFPAAAFAWKMNEEFFKDSKFISDLKLRVGYGITGQQNLGAETNGYSLQQIVVGGETSQYYFGPTPVGVALPSVYNDKLKWEETTTYNVGLDYGFYSNRINGSLDLFYKESRDQLSKTALPDGGNFSNRGYQNIGDFTTKGVEFSINAAIAKSQDFNWNVNFNVTKFERRIDKLALNSDILLGDTGAGTGGTVQILREGYTPYSFYVFKQLYDTNNNPIEGAYADLNGDGIVNDSDKYLYKNPDPDATFGFASNLYYKNFDFSFNLRASIGNRVYNAVNAGKAQYDFLEIQSGTVLGNVPTSVLETDFNSVSNVVLSDIYVENASFLRMDNITVGYTFPKWLEGTASVRLSAGVQNAFVLTKYSGLDPEITNDGRDNTIYPRQRSILFGVNVKF
jgi:TonB-linked SusC/RagA family outer membrane protein